MSGFSGRFDASPRRFGQAKAPMRFGVARDIDAAISGPP
jgi:hypothetical protein